MEYFLLMCVCVSAVAGNMMIQKMMMDQLTQGMDPMTKMMLKMSMRPKMPSPSAYSSHSFGNDLGHADMDLGHGHEHSNHMTEVIPTPRPIPGVVGGYDNTNALKLNNLFNVIKHADLPEPPRPKVTVAPRKISIFRLNQYRSQMNAQRSRPRVNTNQVATSAMKPPGNRYSRPMGTPGNNTSMSLVRPTSMSLVRNMGTHNNRTRMNMVQAMNMKRLNLLRTMGTQNSRTTANIVRPVGTQFNRTRINTVRQVGTQNVRTPTKFVRPIGTQYNRNRTNFVRPVIGTQNIRAATNFARQKGTQYNRTRTNFVRPAGTANNFVRPIGAQFNRTRTHSVRLMGIQPNMTTTNYVRPVGVHVNRTGTNFVRSTGNQGINMKSLNNNPKLADTPRNRKILSLIRQMGVPRFRQYMSTMQARAAANNKNTLPLVGQGKLTNNTRLHMQMQSVVMMTSTLKPISLVRSPANNLGTGSSLHSRFATRFGNRRPSLSNGRITYGASQAQG